MWKDEPSWRVDIWEGTSKPSRCHHGYCPTSTAPTPLQHTRVLTPFPLCALPGHELDISGGTSCTTLCLALTGAFQCSWPSLKPDNRPSRAGHGRLKGERGVKSPPCSQHGCLPAQDVFLYPSISGTPTFPGLGAGTPACQELCFKRRNRKGFLVFFSGALAPPLIHSIQGMLLLSEISAVSTQIKIRLNVSNAEIPHGSRWRGGTLSQLFAFSPSLPRSGTKASIYSMLSDHSIQLSQHT